MIHALMVRLLRERRRRQQQAGRDGRYDLHAATPDGLSPATPVTRRSAQPLTP
jgi:hypothetical protein